MQKRQGFIEWQSGMEARHRANYRDVVETGAIKPLMVFLVEVNIPRNSLQGLQEAISIPLETLRDWRQDLRKNPEYRLYSRPANISKRAFTQEEKQALDHQLWSDYRVSHEPVSISERDQGREILFT
jgi:hypothetical protein